MQGCVFDERAAAQTTLSIHLCCACEALLVERTTAAGVERGGQIVYDHAG